jgi:signal transduction histidine kinase
LLNLILNACEAMEACPAGERLLVVSTACLDGHVRISVADTGCGSPLDLQRVFEPFYTTKPLGLGLGLAICRSIIAAHRGRLWAEVRPPAKSGQAHGGGVFHIELEALPRE